MTRAQLWGAELSDHNDKPPVILVSYLIILVNYLYLIILVSYQYLIIMLSHQIILGGLQDHTGELHNHFDELPSHIGEQLCLILFLSYLIILLSMSLQSKQTSRGVPMLVSFIAFTLSTSALPIVLDLKVNRSKINWPKPFYKRICKKQNNSVHITNFKKKSFDGKPSPLDGP